MVITAMMTGYQKEVALFLVLCVVTLGNSAILQKLIPQKGCTGSKIPLCCEAKDISCQVFGPRENNPRSSTCFCDNACTNFGDCCMDYNDTCLSVDCRVGDWGPYEACSTNCGPGTKERRRPILVHPRNGGRPCGKIVETLTCNGINCKTPRAHEGGLDELRETGKIIPATYGSWRETTLYDPFKGIHKNLYEHYNPKFIVDRPTYCAEFQISGVRKSCRSTYFAQWAPQLEKGATICVECQGVAMKKKLGGRCSGHGVFQKESRWNAVTVPGCHGEWVMKTRRKDCTCNTKQFPSFVLV